jgi:thymidylate synthase
LYSSRLTNYGTWIEKKAECSNEDHGTVGSYEDGQYGVRVGPFNINQVEAVVEKLVKQPFTRQAQMITWMPNMDLKAYDPPCLQSLHFRLVPDENGKLWLNTNIRFRSNDASRAHFQNFFGFIQFIRNKILLPIQERLGQEIGYGRINWQADSFHIYGSEMAKVEDFLLRRIESTEFEDRVYNFFDPDFQEMYHENEGQIIKKFIETKETFGLRG